MTSVAASRVWRSGSCSAPPRAARSRPPRPSAAPSPPPCGRRRAGCFSAATAARYASELGAFELAEPLQRPQRVHRAAVDPDLVDRRVLHQLDQLRHDVLLAALDDQALRRASRHNMLSEASASSRPAVSFIDSDRFGAGCRVLVGDAVDAAALTIAQRRLVGVAGAVAEPVRRRVVLDDEVVPVGEPHRAVRPDLRVDRREPFLGAGGEVPAVARHEAGALLLDDALADEVRRRLVDERDPVPVPPSGTAAPCRSR